MVVDKFPGVKGILQFLTVDVRENVDIQDGQPLSKVVDVNRADVKILNQRNEQLN